MDILMTIITSVVSAVIGALVGAIVAKVKTVANNASDMREMQRLNLMMTCRMAIYDEHFTVDEKVEAYSIYRDFGGNHQTKIYMDGVVGGDIDEYIERHRKKD